RRRGGCGCFCFFFQAEDGIRDFHVTGVQTCALPIYASLDLPLDRGLTVFVGPNGVGKTNVVEAIDWAANLSSHRVASDTPLIKTDRKSTRLNSSHVKISYAVFCLKKKNKKNKHRKRT